jgi:DNA-binding HxlR family transcriptional regulator
VPAYHQFCPVAKAMELLDERWTLLVVRELVTGSQHFNALRRGLPRMSPSLLSKRLQQLTRAGVVNRTDDGRYVLTAAGEELRPVVEALGGWGVRWIGELGDADLDPQLLLWDMHRNVDHAAVPPTQTVLRFHFPDAAPRARDWWLLIKPDDVDVCDDDPGQPVTVTITADLRTMVRSGAVTSADRPRSARRRCDERYRAGSRCRRSPRSPVLNPRVDNRGTLFSTDELRLP